MKEVFLINMYTEDGNIHTQTMGKEMFDSLENSTHRIIYDNDSPVTKISKINILKGLYEQMYYEWKDEKYTKVVSEEESVTKIEEESTAITESDRKDGIIKVYLSNDGKDDLREFMSFKQADRGSFVWKIQKVKNKLKLLYRNRNKKVDFNYVVYKFFREGEEPIVVNIDRVSVIYECDVDGLRKFRFKNIRTGSGL